MLEKFISEKGSLILRLKIFWMKPHYNYLILYEIRVSNRSNDTTKILELKSLDNTKRWFINKKDC